MRQFIFADPEKCTGCGICELICSAFKEKSFSPSLSRIRVVRPSPLVDAVSACRFCRDAPCVKNCKVKALKQDEVSGLLHVDEKLCDGCGKCVEACEFGAIFLKPIKKVACVCDLCLGAPLCVKACPAEALEMTTGDIASVKMKRALQNLHWEDG